MGGRPVPESAELETGNLIPARVKVRQLDYLTTGTNAIGDEIVVMGTGYGPGSPKLDPNEQDLDTESQEYQDAVSNYKYGELIELLPDAFASLVETGAVKGVEVDDDGTVVDDEGEELLDVNDASVDDLVAWILDEKPTVNDVVQASNGEPDLAQKLLEAETQAQDGDPRKGVLDGLSAVISRG